mmetsp:Transcript_93505/g.194975  ORF Transcript_93505/g.194975 Transcript_93505/m.194975 type:complete len:255 (+) Transcript_93505:622-1386(+)
MALLQHCINDLLACFELPRVKGCFELFLLCDEELESLPKLLRALVVRVEGEGLAKQLLALFEWLGPLGRIHAAVVVPVERFGSKQEGLDAPGIFPEHLLGGSQHSRIVFQLQVTSTHLQRHCGVAEEGLLLQVREDLKGLAGSFVLDQRRLSSCQLGLGFGNLLFGADDGRVLALCLIQGSPRSGEITLRKQGRRQSLSQLDVLRVQAKGLLASCYTVVNASQHELGCGDISQDRDTPLLIVAGEQSEGCLVVS